MARIGVALALATVLAAGCGGKTIDAGDWRPNWRDDCPLWSPDGARLAFGRHPTVGSQPLGVYVWDGTTLRRVLEADARVLAWRGRSLVILDDGRVFTLDPASGHERLLLDFGPLGRDAGLDVSVPPTGKRAAVIRTGHTTSESVLFLFDARGAHRVRRGVVRAAWSSHGALAYSDLFRLVVTRPGRRPLVHAPAGSAIVWSPDGRRIAFDRGGSAFASDVWLLDVANGRERRVTHDPGSQNRPSGWVRGGRAIVEVHAGGLAEVDLQGQIIRRLPDWGGAWPGTGVDCATAAADGRVAFLRGWSDPVLPTASVYVAPADLSDARPLR